MLRHNTHVERRFMRFLTIRDGGGEGNGNWKIVWRPRDVAMGGNDLRVRCLPSDIEPGHVQLFEVQVADDKEGRRVVAENDSGRQPVRRQLGLAEALRRQSPAGQNITSAPLELIIDLATAQRTFSIIDQRCPIVRHQVVI